MAQLSDLAGLSCHTSHTCSSSHRKQEKQAAEAASVVCHLGNWLMVAKYWNQLSRQPAWNVYISWNIRKPANFHPLKTQDSRHAVLDRFSLTASCNLLVFASLLLCRGTSKLPAGIRAQERVAVEEIAPVNRWAVFWHANQSLNREQFGSAWAACTPHCESKVKPFKKPLSPRALEFEIVDKNMSWERNPKRVPNGR